MSSWRRFKMATKAAITQGLSFLYAANLSRTPFESRETVEETWGELLSEVTDRGLRFAVRRYIRDGNRAFPTPMDLLAVYHQERNTRAIQKIEERGEGPRCNLCRGVGTRSVVLHKLWMRRHDQGDEDLMVDLWLSEDIEAWADVEAWAAESPHGRTTIEVISARCDCEHGARFGSMRPAQFYIDQAPEVRSSGYQSARPVACRRYVTASRLRFNVRDRPGAQDGPQHVYSPSPEELYGARRGPGHRLAAAERLGAAERAQVLAMARAPDKHAKKRAKTLRRT